VRYDTEHIDDLIGKYLSGEAEQEEIHFVELWAKKDIENRKYLEQCKLIFDKTFEVKELQEFDTDAAWMRMKAKMGGSPVHTIGSVGKKPDRNYHWMIAASIVIIMGIGFFAYRLMMPSSSQATQLVAETETKSDTLPDGSDVFMNKRTALTYTYDKRAKSHRVSLQGEAYFKIQHENEKTFIIDVYGVYIRDIGTAFNVKAYPDSNTIEVYVEEGSVMFYTDTDSGVYLAENGKGIFDKTTKTFNVEKAEENVLAYKTKSFVFNNTDLQSVMLALNNVYDKKIVLDQKLYNCHLTVSFNNEDIDEIAAVIAETLGLRTTASANEIRLEGPGCGN
jgi:ferric-dicitrate binding protein FerR (iron transport regulator)